MEAQGWSKRFRFPGYDGALPKAMRSSRKRGEYQQKSNKPPSDLRFFELLATVAGQILQEKDMHEGNIMRKNDSAKELGDGEEREDGFRADFCSLQYQQLDVPVMHVGVIDKVSISEDHQGLCTAQKMIEKDVENLVPQGASKEAVLGGSSLNSGVCLQKVENVLTVDPKKASNIGDCTKDEGADTLEDILWSRVNGSSHFVSTEATPEMLDPVYLNTHAHSDGHEESDTNCSHFRGRIVRKENSSMTARDSSLQDESPPLVSSGSSEEALTNVHTKLCGMLSERPLERHSEFRQELVRLKARDDDDNFSDLVVPETTSPPRSSRRSFAKALQAKKSPHGSFQGETLVAGSKRKCFQTDDNTNEKSDNNVLNCTRQCKPNWSQGKKKRSTSGFSELCGDPDQSSTLRFSDSDAKDVSVASSPTTTTKASWRSAKKKLREHESSAVKVNITSFTVPELSIDLPETATVANLKRAVMEAAINLLGGGLNVRVLHQGKKVYDESATLVQMGISCQERLDSLAFMLEPNRIPNTVMSMEDSLLALSNATNQPVTWYPVFSSGDDMDGNRRKTVNGKSCVHVEMDTSNYSAIQGKSDVISQAGRSLEPHQCHPPESLLPTSGVLILHPGLKDNEATDVVTAQQNFQGVGVGKRRTRRPFTVTEVEALVQAVESLGTGRWREVKQQAFDHARHRTYVDLKDKWKTLVHTAHIAPHQRRGEPVPQELLDRVLQAHTYWVAQQAKQQEELGL